MSGVSSAASSRATRPFTSMEPASLMPGSVPFGSRSDSLARSTCAATSTCPKAVRHADGTSGPAPPISSDVACTSTDATSPGPPPSWLARHAPLRRAPCPRARSRPSSPRPRPATGRGARVRGPPSDAASRRRRGRPGRPDRRRSAGERATRARSIPRERAWAVSRPGVDRTVASSGSPTPSTFRSLDAELARRHAQGRGASGGALAVAGPPSRAARADRQRASTTPTLARAEMSLPCPCSPHFDLGARRRPVDLGVDRVEAERPGVETGPRGLGVDPRGRRRAVHVRGEARRTQVRAAPPRARRRRPGAARRSRPRVARSIVPCAFACGAALRDGAEARDPVEAGDRDGGVERELVRRTLRHETHLVAVEGAPGLLTATAAAAVSVQGGGRRSGRRGRARRPRASRWAATLARRYVEDDGSPAPLHPRSG